MTLGQWPMAPGTTPDSYDLPIRVQFEDRVLQNGRDETQLACFVHICLCSRFVLCSDHQHCRVMRRGSWIRPDK